MTQENNIALAIRPEQSEQTALLPIAEVVNRLQAVQALMKAAMKKDEDYGVVPGTSGKPTLLKPGSEKLCTLFRLSPTYTREIVALPEAGNGHREYIITCTLTHIPTGVVWGQASGSCSTAESKYRYRRAARVCPHCGKEAISKGSEQYGGGWFCSKKNDGCGAKFGDNDPEIINQQVGRIENTDIADQYNTALKMATKRATVAAVLITTGASALFTQDIEDVIDVTDTASPSRPANQGSQQQSRQQTQQQQQQRQQPRQEAPRQQQQQSAQNGANPGAGSFDDRITGAKLVGQSPANAPRPWKRWEIATAGGTVMATFSETIYQIAETAMAEDEMVRIVWEDKGRGAQVTQIQSLNVPVDGAAMN